MKISKSKLISALSKSDENIEHISNQFNRDMEKISLSIKRKANKIIPDLSDEEFLSFELVWNKILEDAGYFKLVNLYIKNLNKTHPLLNKVLETTGLPTTLNSDKINKINIIKKLQLKDLKKIGTDTGARIKQHLAKSFILKEQDDIVFFDTLRESLENTKMQAYSKTYVSTAVNDYRQSVWDLKKEQLVEEQPNLKMVGVYDGNDPDSSMRDFCKCLMNKNGYYSESDANKIKSDKRRRYNCRHFILYITEEQAIDLGYTKMSARC